MDIKEISAEDFFNHLVNEIDDMEAQIVKKQNDVYDKIVNLCKLLGYYVQLNPTSFSFEVPPDHSTDFNHSDIKSRTRIYIFKFDKKRIKVWLKMFYKKGDLIITKINIKHTQIICESQKEVKVKYYRKYKRFYKFLNKIEVLPDSKYYCAPYSKSSEKSINTVSIELKENNEAASNIVYQLLDAIRTFTLKFDNLYNMGDLKMKDDIEQIEGFIFKELENLHK